MNRSSNPLSPHCAEIEVCTVVSSSQGPELRRACNRAPQSMLGAIWVRREQSALRSADCRARRAPAIPSPSLAPFTVTELIARYWAWCVRNCFKSGRPPRQLHMVRSRYLLLLPGRLRTQVPRQNAGRAKRESSAFAVSMRIQRRDQTWTRRRNAYLSADAARGNRTTNSLPRDMPALVALTLPPWSSTSFDTSARPIPKPPEPRLGPLSA